MPIFTFIADKPITIRREVEAGSLDEATELYRAGNYTSVRQSQLPESLRLVEDQFGRVRMRYEGRHNLAGNAYDELLVSCYHVLVRVAQISSPGDSLGHTAAGLVSCITKMRARYAREVEPTREDWIAIAESYLEAIEQLAAGEVKIGKKLATHLRNSEAAVRRALAMARSSDAPSNAVLELYISAKAETASFAPIQEEEDAGPLMRL